MAHKRPAPKDNDPALPTRDITAFADATPVPCRLYRPADVPINAALMWMHGGGFVSGSIDMPEGDEVARAFARAGVAVLSVDYRLVPPLPRARRWRGSDAVRYPAPLLDCLAGWRQLAAEADSLGLDRGRLFIGGASAGGNLAVMTALRTRGTDLLPPAGLLLAYPLLHAALPALSPDLARAVPRRPLRIIGRRSVRWMARCLVGAKNTDRLAEAFPQPDDLAGFPPTLIITDQYDLLRASAEAFADDLRQRGTPVEIRMEPGTKHGHLNHPDEPFFERTMSSYVTWLKSLQGN